MPRQEKVRSLCSRWFRTFPKIPLPVRLPFGAWWLARNDHVSQPIIEGKFEAAEMEFLKRFLHQGMTVLDIGAHHGLYTLLASKCVGPKGKVIAFEPSLRERKALLLHAKLNRCRNLVVEDLALGSEESEAVLYVVDGSQTGCNSLRPPTVASETSLARVRVARLDDWLSERKIATVDFIKLDVEGGELAVLQGADHLLERRPRPVILAEVQDIRTQPWAYRSKEIISSLLEKKYRWFLICPNGSLEPLDTAPDYYDGNYVAFPVELLSEVETLNASIPAASNGVRKA